jgi:hypothetical protein
MIVWLLIVVAVSDGGNNSGTSTFFSREFHTNAECKAAGDWIVRSAENARSTCIAVSRP